MDQNNKGELGEFLKTSHLVRIILIGFLIILLQFPIGMIERTVSERQMRRFEAVEEVTSKWGRLQKLVGPMINVPYEVKITEEGKDGKTVTRTEIKHASFLPESLDVTGSLETTVRYRGIFKVPVYRLLLTVSGVFNRPDFSALDISSENVQWERGNLSVGISDARAISNQAELTWGPRKIPFLPGIGEFGSVTPGIHAQLRKGFKTDKIPFSFRLKLNGSEGAFFAPLGRQTTVNLKSNWTDPSFQGNWLPAQRDVNSQGFEATWSIPFLGRNYPQAWTSDSNVACMLPDSLFGVNLITPIDQYRMSERSLKYEILFLSLIFLALWLFELLLKRRIHSVQYLLVGAGMCLFYLLELALSEHIGFSVAYACASLSVIVLVAAYCVSVLKGFKWAAVIGVVIATLYGYLYVLLMNQDYALLIGTVGLFVILAAVMYLTREVDWHARVGQRQEDPRHNRQPMSTAE